MRCGCPVCESAKTRCPKALFKPFEYAVIPTLPQDYRHKIRVINWERYLRLDVFILNRSQFLARGDVYAERHYGINVGTAALSLP